MSRDADAQREPLVAPQEPLVAPQDARVFASLVSRLAAGFDLAALSTAEAIFLAELLERGTCALWRVHGADLVIHLTWPDDELLGDDELEDSELF
jgi:hypothetical protein